VSFIPGLSLEDPEEIEIQLDHICKLISRGFMDPGQSLPALPGIQFALESAMLDLEGGGKHILFPSDFTRGSAGIQTNGLIWMGDPGHMKEQIEQKIQAGFRVLKLKVGALGMEEELEVLSWVRNRFGELDLEIRLDANGAWTPEEALRKMEQFAAFGIHSLEQPVAAGQWDALGRVCREAPVPVALDEELIGLNPEKDGASLLESIQPSYLILKPGLLGGFRNAERWITLAGKVGIGWWVTSALESSVGLNAIAQWTFVQDLQLPQGLGTGMIYSNNIPSPMQMEGDSLWYHPQRTWDLPFSNLK
jgi:o-succinylbenzoate synthase